MLPVNRSFVRCLLALGASLSFLMALAFGLHTWHFRQTALRASGEVVELRKEGDEGHHLPRRIPIQGCGR